MKANRNRKKNLDKVNDVGRIRQLTVVFFSGDLPELHFVNGHFRWIKRYWRWRIKNIGSIWHFFFHLWSKRVTPMATLYSLNWCKVVNNESHNYDSLRCSIPKMKHVVMKCWILDAKMPLTVYIFPMKLFFN